MEMRRGEAFLGIMVNDTKQVVLAPEMFKAPGGIARVSRHYLRAIAETTSPAKLALIVLNDVKISGEQLATHHAGRAWVAACHASKWRCALSLWQALRKNKAHVTCTHVALSPLLTWMRRFGCEFTYDIVAHGIEVWKPLPRAQRRALQGARLILSVSDYTRREILNRYPELTKKIHVLPNALDPEFEFSSAESPSLDSPPRLLAVSRMAAHDWEKGIDHVIEAFPAVKNSFPDAILRIVGDGEDQARLRTLASATEHSDAITFLGRIDDDQLKEEFRGCTLFVLPSRKEGFGLVYLEAMAAGKPCIVANAGGAPEVINQQTGIAVPYGEVPQLTASIIEAVKLYWEPEVLRKRASQFSFSSFASRWKKLCLPLT